MIPFGLWLILVWLVSSLSTENVDFLFLFFHSLISTVLSWLGSLSGTCEWTWERVLVEEELVVREMQAPRAYFARECPDDIPSAATVDKLGKLHYGVLDFGFLLRSRLHLLNFAHCIFYVGIF